MNEVLSVNSGQGSPSNSYTEIISFVFVKQVSFKRKPPLYINKRLFKHVMFIYHVILKNYSQLAIIIFITKTKIVATYTSVLLYVVACGRHEYYVEGNSNGWYA